MPSPDRALKRLAKKARHGFRGYPVATIAFYGPDNKRASKLVASAVPAADASPTDLRKWFSDSTDVRRDPAIAVEILAQLEAWAVKTVAMPDRIIGCPHEEGIDYVGDTCPQCPFWAGRDRWTGRKIR